MHKHFQKFQLEKDNLGQFIGDLINWSLKLECSDIHFETYREVNRIRVRRHGILSEAIRLKTDLYRRLVAQIKLLAEMDIAEKRLPQDGSFHWQENRNSACIRVSSCPVLTGETLVLRLLQDSMFLRPIEELGFRKNQEKLFREAIGRKQGLILVTGPTGSGKSTTLYSALNHLNRSGTNIVSIEDPVEIQIPGINQTEINLKANISYQTILRSLLRQDPDIIMIGEIRDSISGEIALKAAQTGHLVLSTLHTTNAQETIKRLQRMGLGEYDIKASLILVVAQRLHLQPCLECLKKVRNPQAGGLIVSDKEIDGCSSCWNGYIERKAGFDLLSNLN